MNYVLFIQIFLGIDRNNEYILSGDGYSNFPNPKFKSIEKYKYFSFGEEDNDKYSITGRGMRYKDAKFLA